MYNIIYIFDVAFIHNNRYNIILLSGNAIARLLNHYNIVEDRGHRYICVRDKHSGDQTARDVGFKII